VCPAEPEAGLRDCHNDENQTFSITKERTTARKTRYESIFPQPASDFNRFYNRAYGQVIVFDSSGNYACGGQGSGAFTQNFQQCQGVACPTPPVCTPTGSPAQPTGSQYQVWSTVTCSWIWVPCPNGVCGNSPIVIDPSDEGFHLTAVTDGVLFDISGSGQPVQIAWTAPDSKNGFLALDRNNNGVIDDGRELFGNFTASSSPNGYLALAEFDKPENGGNGDGIIDSRDDVFSKLRLWMDANHDGISQSDELFTLPSLGIFSLGLRYRSSPRVDQYGNQFRYTSIVNPKGRRDQVNRRDYDVFLVTGATTSQNASNATLLPDKLQ
jgi:hypothetical protein